MISQIEGDLIDVRDGCAHIRCGAITYEVLVPAADQQRLAGMRGETIGFHTIHYLEAQGQGSSMIPRLVGFPNVEEKAFFELFTTVKGMGRRKALRALALPVPTIAEAIAGRDVDTLKSLPEVGKRTAETILAELHGKVDRFVELKPAGAVPAADGPRAGAAALAHDGVALLSQLGESPLVARQLVERALAEDPSIESPDALLTAVYCLKEGGTATSPASDRG